MPRLIDADALVEDLELMAKYQPEYKQSTILGICATIRARKSIDAQPVRHGRWDLETSKYLRRCSACEKVSFYRGAGRYYDFCPQCGAKMDLEVQDDG